jgi:hypothetical protein
MLVSDADVVYHLKGRRRDLEETGGLQRERGRRTKDHNAPAPTAVQSKH